MAEQLKHFFDEVCAQRIADELSAVWPRFPGRAFVAEASQGLEELELLDRGRHFAHALRRALPEDYEETVDLLVRSLGPVLPGGEGNGMAPFRYLPHTVLVAEYGLEHFGASMRAQHALTQRFSAEFSIRAFLVRHPERTLRRLQAWVEDPSFHVRRLVSEGTRPRLPWALRLRAFQEDPTPVLGLLERLKDDPERYVQRSVANNLNDISKDHPERVVEVCARWSEGAPEGRAWLVGHGLRTLVKRGHPGALAVLGFRGGSGVEVQGHLSARRVRIGGTLDVTLEAHNPTTRRQRVVLDLAVHFVKARGDARPKVFKVRPLELAPGERVRVQKRVAFREMTTRTHHPGVHRVEALVNGRAVALGEVVLVPAPALPVPPRRALPRPPTPGGR
ncbi:MAG: DNA alkylation repair protein [Myxococcaceae bacterium]|nr:DNA alkylation repair protein [Myxococcaceae bacterium]MCI0672424.1 DNA alkylation repair protein [Myxococcaceae bacterium]